MFFTTLYQQSVLIFLILSCVLALWWGERTERIAAVAMFAAWIVTPFAANPDRWSQPQYGVLAVDLVLLAVLVAISLRTDRWWPLWATAFHAVGVCIHIAVMVDPKVWPRAYFFAGGIFGRLTLIALVVGAVNVRRRRRRLERAADPAPSI
jgi:hypothetical protein